MSDATPKFEGEVTLASVNPRVFFPMVALPATTLLTSLGVYFSKIGAFHKGQVALGLVGVATLTLIATLLAAFVLRLNMLARRKTLRVQADARGLRAEGREVLARGRIRDGYVVPRGARRPLVRLAGRGLFPLLDVEVENAQRGEELLRALELDVLHKSLDVRGVCNTDGVNLPARIVVGADGVLVKPLGFFAYADIERVEVDRAAVVVHRRAGSPLRLGAGVRRDILFERIREARDAYRKNERAVDAAALVARGGRPVDAWVRDLRKLTSGEDYRSASVPAEALWRIAEDPAAAAEARAGAAAALAPSLDDAGRARLRVAAAATGAPKLRVALEAAAEPEEARLEAALEECTREEE